MLRLIKYILFLQLFNFSFVNAGVPFITSNPFEGDGVDEIYTDSIGLLSREKRKEIQSFAKADTLHYWEVKKGAQPYIFTLDTLNGEHNYYLLCVHEVFVDKYKANADDIVELRKQYQVVKSLCTFLEENKNSFDSIVYKRLFRLKKNLGNRIIHLKRRKTKLEQREVEIMED